MSLARVLIVLALAGGLAHHGVLPTPEPIREAVRSAEQWRDERIATLRCRAAVVAALTSADEEPALDRVEAQCGGLSPQLDVVEELRVG